MANYRYNGVELPALPEYDKTLYPYAVIEAASGTRGELLTVMPSDAAYFSSNGYWFFGYQNYGSSNPKVGLSWKYDSESNEWVEYVGRANICLTVNSGVFSDTNEVWSNFDILNEDGSIYLAASDPVPVGGEPEQPEEPETPTLTNRDLYRTINGKPVKLTLYKKVGGKLIPLDEYTKEVKT